MTYEQVRGSYEAGKAGTTLNLDPVALVTREGHPTTDYLSAFMHF
jgi:hypothetical protein